MQDDVSTAKIRDLIDHRDLTSLAALVRGLSTNRTVRVLSELPLKEAAVVFRLLEKNMSLKAFEELDQPTQADLISQLSRSQVLDIFRSLDPEDQTWLLDEVPSKVAKQIVSSLDPAEVEDTMNLLGYRRDSIGRRMSPQELRSNPSETAAGLLALTTQTTTFCLKFRCSLPTANW